MAHPPAIIIGRSPANAPIRRPSTTPQIETSAVTTPIAAAEIQIPLPAKASPAPTASASRLVATAGTNNALGEKSNYRRRQWRSSILLSQNGSCNGYIPVNRATDLGKK